MYIATSHSGNAVGPPGATIGRSMPSAGTTTRVATRFTAGPDAEGCGESGGNVINGALALGAGDRLGGASLGLRAAIGSL